LATIDWDSQKDLNDSLFSGSVFKRLLGLVSNSNKIRGYVGVRGNLHVKIMLSTQAFQSGALILHCVPNPDELSMNSSNLGLTKRTGGPNAIMIINQDSSVDLEIPFLYPDPFYNNSAATRLDPDYTNLSVLVPLSSGEATTCQVQVYAWLDQAEVSLPTSLFLASLSSVDDVIEEFGGLFNTLSHDTRTSLLAYLDNYGHVQSYNKTTGSTSLNFFDNVLNSNGSAPHHIFSFKSDNNTEAVHKIYSQTEDDMSIDNLCAKEQFHCFFSWKTSDTTGKMIGNIYLNTRGNLKAPTNIRDQSPRTKITEADYFLFISQYFQYWRADFNFKIYLTKTPFHSGRFKISFVPAKYLDTTPVNDTTDNYSKIVDLNSKISFVEYSVPFSSTTLALHTDGPLRSGSNLSNIGILNEYNTLGSIHIESLSPLVAPTSVHDSVYMVVMRSMTNVSFGGRTIPRFIPVYVSPTNKSRLGAIEDKDNYGENQSNNITPPSAPLTQETPEAFVKESTETPNQRISHTLFGEHITSILDIISVPQMQYTNKFEDDSKNDLCVVPNVFAVHEFDTASYPAPLSKDLVLTDPLDHFAQAFCLYKGGVCLRFLRTNVNDIGSVRLVNFAFSPAYNGKVRKTIIPNDLETFTDTSAIALNYLPQTLLDPQIQPEINVLMPHRSIHPVLCPARIRTNDYYAVSTLRGRKCGTESLLWCTNVNRSFFRNAAPGFSFHYPIGAPVLALNYTE
jgi:hypothetical protein